MILIATCSEDGSADYVIEKLRERKVGYRKLALDSVRTAGSVKILPQSRDWMITDSEGNVSSEEITAVWQRRLPRRQIHHSEKNISDYLTQEWRFLWEWWIQQFPAERVLDSEINLRAASNKMLQLEIAQDLGLSTPKTIITNDSETFKAFLTQHPKVIVKTLAGFGRVLKGGDSFGAIYTNRVDRSNIPSPESLKSAPILLQEEISKAYEIRVTVVENQVFSCRIDSQQSNKTKIDWRRYDFANVPHSIIKIEEEVEKRILQMMQRFNIHFASVDLAVTPEGETFFFEINPNSQWVWIENLTGMPITNTLIDALLTRAV